LNEEELTLHQLPQIRYNAQVAKEGDGVGMEATLAASLGCAFGIDMRSYNVGFIASRRGSYLFS
jgi:hypothetical protein